MAQSLCLGTDDESTQLKLIAEYHIYEPVAGFWDTWAEDEANWTWVPGTYRRTWGWQLWGNAA